MGTIKYMTLVMSTILFLSCTGNNTKQQVETQHNMEYVLREMLDSCLQAYPNANNNDVTRSILADSMKSKFQRYRGHRLTCIEDLPFEYEMCLVYPQTEINKSESKYVVKFGFGEVSSKCKLSDKYETAFQVFAIMEKEMVATLVDGSLYHIKGIFRDFANNTRETGFTLPSGKCLVDYPSVSISAFENKPFINLGTLVIDSLSFSPVKQQ